MNGIVFAKFTNVFLHQIFLTYGSWDSKLLTKSANTYTYVTSYLCTLFVANWFLALADIKAFSHKYM